MNYIYQIYVKHTIRCDIINWLLVCYALIVAWSHYNDSDGPIITASIYGVLILLWDIPLRTFTGFLERQKIRNNKNIPSNRLSELEKAITELEKRIKWHWVILNACALYMFYSLT